MMPINAIQIPLELEQVKAMRPALEQARDAGIAGQPGLLLAQILGETMAVFFVPHDRAMEIQRVLVEE